MGRKTAHRRKAAEGVRRIRRTGLAGNRKRHKRSPRHYTAKHYPARNTEASGERRSNSRCARTDSTATVRKARKRTERTIHLIRRRNRARGEMEASRIVRRRSILPARNIRSTGTGRKSENRVKAPRNPRVQQRGNLVRRDRNIHRNRRNRSNNAAQTEQPGNRTEKAATWYKFAAAEFGRDPLW